MASYTNKIHCKRMYKTQTQIKFIQINLQHSKLATDNLLKIIEEDSTDTLCIQELYTIQNVGLSKKYKFLRQEKEEIRQL